MMAVLFYVVFARRVIKPSLQPFHEIPSADKRDCANHRAMTAVSVGAYLAREVGSTARNAPDHGQPEGATAGQGTLR